MYSGMQTELWRANKPCRHNAYQIAHDSTEISLPHVGACLYTIITALGLQVHSMMADEAQQGTQRIAKHFSVLEDSYILHQSQNWIQ